MLPAPVGGGWGGGGGGGTRAISIGTLTGSEEVPLTRAGVQGQTEARAVHAGDWVTVTRAEETAHGPHLHHTSLVGLSSIPPSLPSVSHRPPGLNGGTSSKKPRRAADLAASKHVDSQRPASCWKNKQTNKRKAKRLLPSEKCTRGSGPQGGVFVAACFAILLGLFNLRRELNRMLLPALGGGLAIYKPLASAAPCFLPSLSKGNS